MWGSSLGRRSYSNLVSIARNGRSFNGGDRGGKIANETYVFNRGDYFAIRHHNTDIARFYPDRVVFCACGWDTHTTRQRINALTPFAMHRMSTRDKYRRYFTHGDESRVFLSGAPDFGLDCEDGIEATHDGRWIAPPDEQRTVSLMLPRKGARTMARRQVNAFRRMLRPHLTMLQDRRQGAFGTLFSAERMLEVYSTNDGELDRDDFDFAVDNLVSLMQHVGMGVDEALRTYIKPEVILRHHYEARLVHHSEVPALLDVRGPEWAD